MTPHDVMTARTWSNPIITARNAVPPNDSTTMRAVMLSVGEMAVGAALLAPVVTPAIAGAALTGFAGALVTMYLRTDSLHKRGSSWPTVHGAGVSQDVWMLAIGLGLILDEIRSRTDR
jgi:hypothetical protein